MCKSLIHLSKLACLFAWACLGLIAIFAGCSEQAARSPISPDDIKRSPEKVGFPSPDDLVNEKVAELIATEDLILDLTFRLQNLGKWMADHNRFDQGRSQPRALFADLESLESVRPLAEFDWASHRKQKDRASSTRFHRTVDWPIAENASRDGLPINPLGPLVDELSLISSAKFGVLSGAFTDESHSGFEMETKLSGKGEADGAVAGFKGKQKLVWRKVDGDWTLVTWTSHSMKVTSVGQKIFQDVTKNSLPDKQDRIRALRSYHGEFIDSVVSTGKMPQFGRYTSFIDAASPHALPSVSIVDFDGDHWDDIFIGARWGPTQLLHNKQDGTFTDVAKERGLQFQSLVNCSVFVDLDNDGDQDAIIGRSLEPMIYLRNDGGKFVDVTDELSDLGDRYMVSAIAVSDINRDGLPDLYCSTYGPFGQNEPGTHIESADWRDKFLSATEKRTLAEKHQRGHGFVDNAGPPNFVVMNRGEGKLEVAKTTELLQQWHHSYQTAWADIDQDGDDDLYIANDFANDAFLINETPAGSPQPIFTDGLKELFPGGGVGFGMGVSWSDFDSDGDFDLYVSNMYSKAGARILQQLGPGDHRMEIATRGNFLYENNEGVFENNTGTGEGQFNVGQVGWSYGGQFIDIDNNGFDDLYVPCGYFTASSDGDTKVDI